LTFSLGDVIVFSGSWRTTAAGIVAGLSLILAQVGNLLDSDPATKFEYTIVAAAVAGIIAAISARDNKVSSEEAGA
jgi:uncharacterized membrane protein YgaE (UPF0421/DUF939 family)